MQIALVILVFFCIFVQFSTEARLLQELSVKWKEHVNQRNTELYSKYGGALDLEV